jgi:hypothetical protein
LIRSLFSPALFEAAQVMPQEDAVRAFMQGITFFPRDEVIYTDDRMERDRRIAAYAQQVEQVEASGLLETWAEELVDAEPIEEEGPRTPATPAERVARQFAALAPAKRIPVRDRISNRTWGSLTECAQECRINKSTASRALAERRRCQGLDADGNPVELELTTSLLKKKPSPVRAKPILVDANLFGSIPVGRQLALWEAR